MELKTRLSAKMTEMIQLWHRKDEQGCYREFFSLSLEDRRLVEEAFKQARKKWPQAHMRKDAKGIYDLIQKNFDREVSFMTDTTFKLLEYWFFQGKEAFYNQFIAPHPQERELILAAMKDEIAKDDNEEMRQAAEEIPVYIRSREQPASTTPV